MRFSICLLLATALVAGGCATSRRDAQAGPRARHTYREAQRHHTRARHRAVPLVLPWN